MDKRIAEIIKNRLLCIETEHDVKILLAVESGSRAWGFESADSDYDVRFIYAHKKDWYLNILPKRDVIEYPIDDEFDYSGWDLRKTLFLMNKSNPVLFEWLKSPIVYTKDEFAFTVLKDLASEYFSAVSSLYHYLHMARGNYREYLQGDEVKVKKYFYVLRPLLACLWIEKYKESPPMEFEKLMTLLPGAELIKEVVGLLERKRDGLEREREARIPVINDFISDTITHFENATSSFNPLEKPPQELLEKGFISILDSLEKERYSK
jgi:predicted nucleotidyltransferase